MKKYERNKEKDKLKKLGKESKLKPNLLDLHYNETMRNVSEILHVKELEKNNMPLLTVKEIDEEDGCESIFFKKSRLN